VLYQKVHASGAPCSPSRTVLTMPSPPLPVIIRRLKASTAAAAQSLSALKQLMGVRAFVFGSSKGDPAAIAAAAQQEQRGRGEGGRGAGGDGGDLEASPVLMLPTWAEKRHWHDPGARE
jgi:hypothetical protein